MRLTIAGDGSGVLNLRDASAAGLGTPLLKALNLCNKRSCISVFGKSLQVLRTLYGLGGSSWHVVCGYLRTLDGSMTERMKGGLA